MDTRTSASVLWLRALFAGSFAFFLGVAGHLMANGLLPGTAFLVALYLFTVVISVPVLVIPGSRARMLGLQVGGQTFIHLCLTLTAGHVGDPRTPSARTALPDLGVASLPQVDGKRVGSLQEAFHGSDQLPRQTPTLPIHHVIADMSAHLPMMVAHLVAAALVALWLAHGERRVLTVLQLTGRYLLTLVVAAAPVAVRPRPRPHLAAAEAVETFRELLLRRSVSRRGPPLLAV